MKKRVLAALMAMMLTVLSVQTTVCAENEETKENLGDAIVTMTVENAECLQLSELEAADITAVISLKNKPEFEPLEIPVEALDLNMEGEDAEISFWLGYQEDAIERAFLDYLSDIQGDVFGDIEEELEEDDLSAVEEDAEEMLDETSALLNAISIEFKGLPEHYKADMEYTIVTSELVKAVVEMVEELLLWIYPDVNMEELGIKGLLDEILKQEGSSLDELIAELAKEDPTLADEVKKLFDEIDEVLKYMQSDEFPGLLFAGATLSCDCPVKEYGQIVHEYYKNINGTLESVGIDCVDIEDYSGTIIKAEDYIKCEYDGVVYEYMGSYDANVAFDEAYFEYDWSGFELDEFSLGDENCWGLYLRYEIEEKAPVDLEDEKDNANTDDTQMDNTEEKTEVKTEVKTDKEAAPATGDNQTFALYLVAFITAISVIVFKMRKIKS